MSKELFMITDASYTLNFMLYIQNIYLNQHQTDDEYRFPYGLSSLAFKGQFESDFKELWKELTANIADDNRNGMKLFVYEKELFYKRLLINNPENQQKYDEIHQSFSVWWQSFAGGFSIERSIDDTLHQVYVELAETISRKGIEPKRDLNISLIYDECILGKLEVSPYFAVLSTSAFLKKNELVRKLVKYIV